ncbi:hypothetical protein H5410_046267 [Solanum commersonii]|uniref:Uncharacterized protein n=1 Tax=Solanum commersonii TaxID=4109 RepID=A0A9J5XBT2_SOLCO|nr:hypothetical protein H5410_046267 [Solanum commersonii]
MIMMNGYKVMNILQRKHAIISSIYSQERKQRLTNSLWNSFQEYDRVKRYTGFHQKETPITYLSCPLFIGRPRLIYFSELISKIVNRITGWQSKMLGYGGKATLIKHVLQSMPIHILSTIPPPPFYYS